MKIPRVMSTQHPDNVKLPFFAQNQDMSGNDEIHEAYYAFSHIGCDEQMWDCEGKEADAYVVRKLLTRYEHFFKHTRLGEDVRLTLRLPNPDVEKSEAKVFVETLESIPRSCDTASLFYGFDSPPIREVILPMTMSAESMNRVYHYYKDFVVGKQNKPFYPGDIKISEWFGEFKPAEIHVIPLFEDREHLLEAHNILRAYLADKDIEHQRVFLARSDPAMNYGMVSAILCNKLALQRLQSLSKEIGVKIYPILGVGSAPFRGHLSPETVDMVLNEYPDVQTFTVQSAFKYDYPFAMVTNAINKLHKSKMRERDEIDEERCLQIIDKVSKNYQHVIEHLAPLINYVASFVPRRRMRKLHVGLFGYARSVGDTNLPRVISFCTACYSIGLPPELLGLYPLTDEDLRCIEDMHVNFLFDVHMGMSYFNQEVLTILPEEVKKNLRFDWGSYEINEEHREITSRIIKAVQNRDSSSLQRDLIEAAHIRGFLG
ncbi:Phosphoenolpyruvate carboxylase, archaeal [Dissulfuribacter thermophilus]|uniref:Phosphoenolpyruvate carboxylase n=1 Tax=Dissulfuribacter thermophilus TaxID=1156395 RepID=A0A1B9F6S5_9BACT|nr:phosphoenolpyruvate carboxylase [Dissulfuribacter thermophilus]OCC15606.1 Phosphoenolpyruvate carboxylase, archaeal [Dissulfuribacter thermophilus]